MCSYLLRPASTEKQCLLVDMCSKDSYNAHVWKKGFGPLLDRRTRGTGAVWHPPSSRGQSKASLSIQRNEHASHDQNQTERDKTRRCDAGIHARQVPGPCAMRRFVVSLAQPGRTEKEVLGSTTYLGSEKSKGTVACC